MNLKDDFQERFAAKGNMDAFRKIKDDIIHKKDLEAAALHIGASGLEVGQSMMLSVWSQLQLISALFGGLSMTVLVTSPSFNSAFGEDHTLSSSGVKNAAYCFYLFWALATFFEIAAVVLVTIAQLHYSLMIDSLDALWFIETWKIYVWILPRVFVVCGCCFVVLGCISAIFLIADIYIATAIAITGVFLMLLVAYIWVTMLKANIARKNKSVERYMSVLLEVLVPDSQETTFSKNEMHNS